MKNDTGIEKAGFYRAWFEIANSFSTDSDKLAFYDMIMNYSFNGVEPSENIPIAMKQLFMAIKPNINADIRKKNGGAPVGNKNAVKKEVEPVEEKQPKNNLKTTPKTTKTNNVKDNDNDNVKDNDKGDVKEVVSLPPDEEPSEYSKQIFDIFHDNDLPCANNNELTFFQREFKNGLSDLHKRFPGIHSSEVLEACRNYAECVNNPLTYITNKYSFDRFVNFKNFSDYLPGNFDIKNFYKHELEQKEIEQTEHKAKAIEYAPPCPVCSAFMGWVGEYQRFCRVCGENYNYNEKSEVWELEPG